MTDGLLAGKDMKDLMNDPNFVNIMNSLDSKSIANMMSAALPENVTGGGRNVKKVLKNMTGQEILRNYKAKTQAPIKKTRVVKKRRQRKQPLEATNIL